MSSLSLFAVPSAAQHLHRSQQRAVLKRKRNGQYVNAELSSPQRQPLQNSEIDQSWSAEYTAVVTPLERLQRRLAGLAIDHDPPPLPFPHAPLRQEREFTSDGFYDTLEHESDHKARAKQSLHAQHLAAMTALLHRCMMAKDYKRAARALGLLLRNEVGGQAIDVRSEGIWGIGAEILLRQRSANTDRIRSDQPEHLTITREGFEHARLYYERLMVQYPLHKTWPDAVNELDFGIALFGMRVYFESQESVRLRMKDTLADDNDTSNDCFDRYLLDAKHWELEQARQIAEAMDVRMRNAPFINNHEIIRLRAMVALWIADLIGLCVQLEEADAHERQSQDYGGEDGFSNQVERIVIAAPRVSKPHFDMNEAADCRDYAQTLFEKLGLHDTKGNQRNTS